ncbi:MAG: serpin family protein [Smithellaceae bacterium]|jgi:serpin B|nr:serpin family protein [Smithellaceae bacterium]
MKGKSIFTLALVLLAGFWSCSGPEAEAEITALEKSVMERENAFAWQIFPALNALQEDENILISPFSISTALSMTYNGARGETQTAMAEVLGYSDMSTEDVNRAYRNLITYLGAADDKVTLNIANSIWYDEIFHIVPEFLSVNRDDYDAEVRALDFHDPASIDTINDWVCEKTNEKIETIIDEIPANTMMYLINALYFKAAWTWEFDPELTENMNFRNYDGSTVSIAMMSQKADLDYYRNDDCQVVDLPYGDGKYSLTIILPAYDTDINAFIAEMTQSEWDTLTTSFPEEKTAVDVYLPRFTLEYKAKLKEVLIALGMEVAFDGRADFSGIYAPGGIWINDVYHKTFMEVNEEGTEAAAATAVEVVYESAGPVMMIDRPFFFVIREKESGTMFFMGKMLSLEE